MYDDSEERLIAAGAGGAALLVLLGVWFIFRDRDGNETARIQIPDGGSVHVQQTVPGATPTAIRPTVSAIDFFSTPPAKPAPTTANSAPPPPGDYALYASHVTTPLEIDLSGPITLETESTSIATAGSASTFSITTKPA